LVRDGVSIRFSYTLLGNPTPARAYIDELLPDVLEDQIEPWRVFDTTVDPGNFSEEYAAMDKREALKVIVKV
jgi:hypothetical protein